MKIAAIYTAPQSRAPMESQDAVAVRLGCGIVGDRHYRRNATPENQITLVAREAVDMFNRDYGQRIHVSDLRRNIVTEGVDVNALEGRTFQIAGITLRGIELCEPCSVIGNLLAGDLTPTQVVRALMGHGGLRCEILGSGTLRVGDTISLPS